MIRQLFRDAAIGRQARAAATGIVTIERFAGQAPIAIIDWDAALGEFEIVVRRKGGGNG